MPEKPNCYKCKHRGTVIGDAHSSCHYPGTKTGLLDFFMPENLRLATELEISGDPHGVRNGWFLWPVSFDPVWLLSCNGFTPREAARTTILIGAPASA